MLSVARPSMRLPPRVISPPVFTMPHTARSVVVFPAPLAPRMVVMPPSATSKETPRSTRVSP